MPDWGQFQRQHVLSPVLDKGSESWTRADWNNWQRTRLGSDFGKKNINSVIVADPERILQDYATLTDHVQHDRGPDFYWSNSRYTIFVMTLNRSTGDYDVRRLGEMYFLALVYTDPNRPVHFHAQSPDRITRGNVNLRFSDYPFVP